MPTAGGAADGHGARPAGGGQPAPADAAQRHHGRPAVRVPGEPALRQAGRRLCVLGFPAGQHPSTCTQRCSMGSTCRLQAASRCGCPPGMGEFTASPPASQVALDEAAAVIGCIDIRLPESATGQRPSGVPIGETHGCYILNVVSAAGAGRTAAMGWGRLLHPQRPAGGRDPAGACQAVHGCSMTRDLPVATHCSAIPPPCCAWQVVSEGRRGQGVGRALMKAAMARAVQQWGATGLYTHVQAGPAAGPIVQRCAMGPACNTASSTLRAGEWHCGRGAHTAAPPPCRRTTRWRLRCTRAVALRSTVQRQSTTTPSIWAGLCC